MGEQQFDLVILGGGSGGYACAACQPTGDERGVDREGQAGGYLFAQGLHPHQSAVACRGGGRHRAGVSGISGVAATLEGIDMPSVNKYRDSVVGRLYKGLQGLVKSRAVTYVEGTGHPDGAQRRRWTTRTCVGRAAVLANRIGTP